MRRLLVILTLIVLAACSKKETATTETVTATTASSATATAAPPPPAAQNAPSLVSFYSGALIAQKPQEYDANWSAFWMFDEKPDTGWASPQNVVTPQTIVVALPERSQIEQLAFDTGGIDGNDGRGAKDITVEMSDTSATSGFQKIASVSLQDQANDQRFPVTAQVPGRWLRLVVQNNHGSKEYIELMDVRAYGRQLTTTPFPNASGTYETDYGNFHLKQEGTSVTGCYEHDEGLLNGGIEGRIMKFTWREAPNDKGPAIMIFSPDGNEMFGLWWNEGDTTGRGGIWNGKKISKDTGSCPHWSGTGAEELMKKELEEFGRTRVYGINFDLDSDVLRDESKPTLDKIVAVLKAKPEWKLKVEGHTDSTGGEAHNQQLSQKRADAVKSYLVNAGIDGSRLTTAGLGATKPVSGNETESGRAQNRRVELAKE